MRRMGGYRSDDQRKAMFANMNMKKGQIENHRTAAYASPNVKDFLRGKKSKKKEEPQFSESSPANVLVNSPSVKALSIVQKCRLNQKYGIPKLSQISSSKNREETLRILRELQQKHYVLLTEDGEDIKIKLLPGGYAGVIKDTRVEYAKYLHDIDDHTNELKNKVNHYRKYLISYESEAISGYKEVREDAQKCIKQGYDPENIDFNKEKYEKIIENCDNLINLSNVRLEVLRDKERMFVVGASDKIVKDVLYMLENYFEISDPFLVNNFLFIDINDVDSPDIVNYEVDEATFEDESTMTVRCNLGVNEEYTIEKRHDIKTDSQYRDALARGISLWLREVDMSRSYMVYSIEEFKKLKKHEDWKQ